MPAPPPGPRKALVIQNDAAEPPQRLATLLGAAGVVYELVRAWNNAGHARLLELELQVHGTPAAAAPWCSGLIVLGGPQSATRMAASPTLAEEVLLLESALASRIPVLGICLGAQLLAVAAGGSVRSGQAEVGWCPLALTAEAAADPLFAGLPPQVLAFHWHSDSISLPPGACHLACSELTPVQAFRVGELAWGLQFHPESTPEGVAGMLRQFGAQLNPAEVNSASVLGSGEQHAALDALGRQLLGNWARLVRTRISGQR